MPFHIISYLCNSSDDMTNMDILSIKRKSLAEEVAERLQKQISNGNFAIGEKLPTEPELMKMFGVGRSSIREAVRILMNMGLLNVQQGSGTYVTSSKIPEETIEQKLRRADISDLDEVRTMLEYTISEKAAINRTLKDIEKMKAYLAIRKAKAQEGNLIECVNADMGFHNAIANATKNMIMADLYQNVSHYLKDGFLHIYKDTNYFIASQSSHERLLKAIIKGEPGKISKIVKILLEEP